MLGSWDQPKVRGPFNRFSGSMRDLIGRVGSVVQLILWINVFVFLVQLVCSLAKIDLFEQLFALGGEGARRGFVWQLVTYMFLHDTGNLFHILINLLVLWFIGREVEYFIGPKYFTRLYLFGGITGGLLWLAFNFGAPAHLVGASAGVLACVIAFATLFPDRQVLFYFIPIPARVLALILIVVDIFPLLSRSNTGVAHLAHLAGAALGYVYIKHLGYGKTPRWMQWFQSAGNALRPKRRPPPRAMSDEEYMREQIDPILDKIAREGMQSLTRRERKILESAKDHVGKRQR